MRVAIDGPRTTAVAATGLSLMGMLRRSDPEPPATPRMLGATTISASSSDRAAEAWLLRHHADERNQPRRPLRVRRKRLKSQQTNEMHRQRTFALKIHDNPKPSSGELRKKILVCLEPAARRTEGAIDILPADEFARRLWAGEITG